MLITEELLLLLTKPEGKAENWGMYASYGMAAAVVTDLIVAERVTLSQDKDPRVGILSPQPTGNPILDPALARLGEKSGKKLSGLIMDRKLDPTKNVVEALTKAGIIAVEPKRMLGLIPEKRPTLNPMPEQRVRDRLRSVLAGSTPTIADAALLSILQGLDVAHKILQSEAGGLTKRELKQRIKAVSAAMPAGNAVERCVQMMTMVIVTAAIMPAITSGAAG